MINDSVAMMQRRVRVALGHEPADLLLTGGNIVNVFTLAVEQADIAIVDSRIAGVGRYPWAAKQTIDITGRYVMPGFIDAHMHVESTMMPPSELPCPPRNLVSEWVTISAPCSNGRHR